VKVGRDGRVDLSCFIWEAEDGLTRGMKIFLKELDSTDREE